MTTTSTMLKAAKEQAEGERDANEELYNILLGSKKLDLICKAFFLTNQYHNKTHDLKQLIRCKHTLQNRRYYKFIYDDVTYLATVTTRDMPDAHYLVLKLGHTNFQYPSMGGDKIQRHSSDGWVPLVSHKAMAFFPYLLQLVREHFSEGRIFCNPEQQRIDLQFRDPTSFEGLMVTFEHAIPDQEDTIAWRPIE